MWGNIGSRSSWDKPGDEKEYNGVPEVLHAKGSNVPGAQNHMRRRIHVILGGYMSYEEEDTCHMREDTCHMRECACHMRRIHVIRGGGYMSYAGGYMSYEGVCMSYEEEDTCHMRRRIYVKGSNGVPGAQNVCVCVCMPGAQNQKFSNVSALVYVSRVQSL